MKRCALLAVILVAAIGFGVQASGWRQHNTELKVRNLHLHGKVIDHTANHGQDNRFWSRVLGKRRDMYVYLPPGFDPHLRYPLILLLHGPGQDEDILLDLVKTFDTSMRNGEMPLAIIAAPDGTFDGMAKPGQIGSLFLNSDAGDFEDYLLNDVWDFIVSHYPVRAERQAHVLMGYSTGGFSAYELAIRNRYCFGVVVGLSPAVNLRWVDDKGYYLANFDPHHWGWRTDLEPHHEPVLLTNHSAAAIKLFNHFLCLYPSPEQALINMSCLNPIELVDRTKLRQGELDMYIAYGGKDELNFDAQVESFLYLCHFRRLGVGVGYDPEGHHDLHTTKKLFRGMAYWLAARLENFGPYSCPGDFPPGAPAVAAAHEVQRPKTPATGTKTPAKKSSDQPATRTKKAEPKSEAEFLPDPELPRKGPRPRPQPDQLGPKAGPPLNTFTPVNPLPPAPKVPVAAAESTTPPTLPAPPAMEGPPTEVSPPAAQPPAFLPEPGPRLGPSATSAAPPQNGIIQTKGVFYPWR